jgi:hypothetical protein
MMPTMAPPGQERNRNQKNRSTGLPTKGHPSRRRWSGERLDCGDAFLSPNESSSPRTEKDPNDGVVCHLPDYCHYTCVRCLRIARNAPSNSLQLYGLRPFAPYIFAGSLNALAWTITPILIVVVLFLATARVIHAIQDAPEPAGAVEFTLSTLPTL